MERDHLDLEEESERFNSQNSKTLQTTMESLTALCLLLIAISSLPFSGADTTESKYRKGINGMGTSRACSKGDNNFGNATKTPIYRPTENDIRPFSIIFCIICCDC